jgi:hypothetical protein
MTNRTYLALYTGPNGPISATFESNAYLAEILAHVAEHGRTWYDGAANDLELEPDASESRVEAALAAEGAELFAAAPHTGAYAVYRLRPLLERMRESSAFRQAAAGAAHGYVVAAEWTELGTDSDWGEGAALSEAWVASESEIVAAFVAQNWADFELYCEQRATDPSEGGAAEYFGHDLWLTRNGHGAGFWARGELARDLRDRLAAAAAALGEVDIECDSAESAEYDSEESAEYDSEESAEW